MLQGNQVLCMVQINILFKGAHNNRWSTNHERDYSEIIVVKREALQNE